MVAVKRKQYILLFVVTLLILSGVIVYVFAHSEPSPATSPTPEPGQLAPEPSKQPNEQYEGEKANITESVSIKIPNGWSASLSNDPNFAALMFARTNEIASLQYDANTAAVINKNTISLSNGLAEHFFILVPNSSQQFNDKQHLEISSESFIFNNGHEGEKHYVVKHEAEAERWGGLQKDTEWQGRTYIYEKDGVRAEAHLAKYPSTNIDIDFFEKVIKTLEISD